MTTGRINQVSVVRRGQGEGAERTTLPSLPGLTVRAGACAAGSVMG